MGNSYEREIQSLGEVTSMVELISMLDGSINNAERAKKFGSKPRAHS